MPEVHKTPGPLASVAIYGASFALVGATPFLLLPVLTRALSVEEFGMVTSFIMVVVVVGNIAGLGTNGFLPVRFFKESADEYGRTVFTAIVGISVVHGLVGVVLGLAVFMGLDLGLSITLVMLSILVALLNGFSLNFLAICQAQSRPWRYFKIRALQAGVELGVCLLLLRFWSQNHHARIDSYALAICATALLGFWFIRRSGLVSFTFCRSAFVNLLRFGVPLIPHIIAGTVVVYTERSIILASLGTESLGIYMAGMQVGMAMLLVIEPVNKAFAPWLFKRLSDGGMNKRRVVMGTYGFFVLLLAGGALLTLLSMSLFHIIVGPEFVEARNIVPFLVFGFVFQGMYYAVTNYVFYAEQTGSLSKVTCAVSLFGVAVSWLAINEMGLAGAGIGFLATNVILFLAVWRLSYRSVPMPWFERVTIRG